MKPLAFNLSDAKKTAQDAHSSTFTLKGGHIIKVAHAPLPAMQRKALERLPLYQATPDGPVTAPADSDSDDEEATAPAQPDLSAVTQRLQSAPLTDQTGAPLPPPVDLAAQVTPEAAGPQTPYQAASLEGGINKQIFAAEAQGAAAQAQATANVATETAYQKTLSDAQAKLNDLNTHMSKDLGDAVEAIKAGRIDPNHYLENQSTPQKVATAIGLALGGFSTAFTHQGNPALEWLNAQIQRDVDAQKANLNHKSTVYQAYLEKYKNAQVAQQMALATQQGIYASKIRQAGAQAGGANAQAAADMTAGQLEQQASQTKNNAMLIQAAQPFTNPTAGGPMGTEAGLQSVLNAATTLGHPLAKTLGERYLPGIGIAAPGQEVKPEDKAEFETLGNTATLAKQALALSQDKSITVKGSPANQRAAYLQNQLSLLYMQENGLKRFSPELWKQISTVVANPGQWNQPQAQQSLKDILENTSLRAASKAKALGIKPFSK